VRVVPPHRRARAVRLRAGAALASLAWLAVLAPAPRAQAQARTLGAQDCEKCHKPALRKWKFDEPAQLGPNAHANTHKQLSDAKAAGFAAAIGVADPRDPKGRCVACHATVVRGIVRSGVSCESCHGPASLYNPVHDKEPLVESYRKSIPLGLRDLHARPAAIAALCVGCHVTPDRALALAGHPDGAGFDAGASLKKLVHWTAAFTGDGSEHASYDYAQVTAAARPLVQKALTGRGAAKPGTPAGGGLSPGGTPPPARRPSPAGTPAPPAPWDWDRPIAPLPDDYPSDAGAAAAGVEATAPAAGGEPTPAPRATRRALSIVVDQPALAPPEVAAPAPPPAAGGAHAASATSEAAALRGQAAALLARLLARGRRAPELPPAHPPQEFKGPDSELLNIQDVALYLALETLRQSAPAAGAAPRRDAP
jgi:hypothetical protein